MSGKKVETTNTFFFFQKIWLWEEEETCSGGLRKIQSLVNIWLEKSQDPYSHQREWNSEKEILINQRKGIMNHVIKARGRG